MNFVALLGARALNVLRSFGHAAFFFLDLLRAIAPAAFPSCSPLSQPTVCRRPNRRASS